ncbi:MAG: hypothetical protein LBR82_09545 [Desulfovibrio sp.]|jgi:hypothetical protein|nr:hypothetical protein [Desulfovibrio sp.]
MRNIHPAAWGGLLLNLAMGWLVFAGINALDLSTLSASDRATAENFIQAVLAVRPLFFGLLILQALALALIASGRGYGLIPAALASFFMLPGSLPYLIGCALSHGRTTFAGYRTAPPRAARTRPFFAFRSAYLTTARALTALFALAAFACYALLRSPDFMLVGAGLTAAGVYCMLRAGKQPALSLHEEYFIFSPAFFAPLLAAAYDDVEEARLEDTNAITFLLRTEAGTRALRWNLRNLDRRDKKEAVTELGAALEMHRVPLH